MANVQKYTMDTVNILVRHDERTEKETTVSRKNETIDPERTNLNQSYWNKRNGLTPQEYIKEYVKNANIRMSTRKDLNVMCSWCVTIPKDMVGNKKEERLFFDEVFKFLKKRYGYENNGYSNIISATVHYDETTPHMHFKFVPTAYDKKNQCYSISAKKVICRTDLQRFHKDLENHMSQVFNRIIGIENGATKNGNLNITQLKLKTQLEKKIISLNTEVCALEREKKRLISTITNLDNSLNTHKDNYNILTKKINDLTAQILTLNEEKCRTLEEVEKLQELCNDEISHLNETHNAKINILEEKFNQKQQHYKSKILNLATKEKVLNFHQQDVQINQRFSMLHNIENPPSLKRITHFGQDTGYYKISEEDFKEITKYATYVYATKYTQEQMQNKIDTLANECNFYKNKLENQQTENNKLLLQIKKMNIACKRNPTIQSLIEQEYQMAQLDSEKQYQQQLSHRKKKNNQALD